MKVLFVTYDFPYPTNSGGKTRAYNLIKQKGSDVDLYLFSFVRSGFDKRSVQHMKKIGVRDVKFITRSNKKSLHSILGALHAKHSIFYGLYYNDVVAKLLYSYVKEKQIDIIHFESYYTAFYLSDIFKDLKVKQIFGTENIETAVYDDYIKSRVPLFLQPIYKMQNRKIKNEEQEMFSTADVTLAVTESEKKYIQKFTNRPVYVIPNGVDLTDFRYSPKKGGVNKILLFVGNFTYHPNVDAVTYFYNNVLEKLPEEYMFHIVGKNAKKLFFANENRVVAHDFVSDIIATYNNADVLVSPMRTGGGTNFKILEAMAVGLPVVAFPHRIEAMGAKNGKEVLTATAATDFAKAIVNITQDAVLKKRITIQARKLIEEKYSWKVIGKEMNRVWRNLV